MGTPVPCKDNESRGTYASNLVEYTLSPEELAKYRAMPNPAKKKSNFRRETTMPFSMTKDEYLAARAAGKTRAEIAKEHQISPPSLQYWIRKWGLSAETEVEAQPANVTVVVPAQPTPLPVPMPEIALSETEPEFDWILPDKPGSVVRINRDGLRISGEIISRLDFDKAVQVGCRDGKTIAIKNAENGWQLRTREADPKSYLVFSKRLISSIINRGFELGCKGEATWDENRQMIIAHIGKGVS